MLPAKQRSSDSPNNRTVPATPNVGKIGRAGSTKSNTRTPSPVQKLRVPPRTVESKHSKPSVESRIPKISNSIPDKSSRAPKGSELQAQLDEAQENLKKAKEQLASAEKEKAQVVEELNDAKKLADDANEKFKEALSARKRAEESSEVEKFRALGLEQASIEASKKREEEWVQELDNIKKKHALDVEAYLSATRELEKVKDELEAAVKAKTSALTKAEDAMRITETNAKLSTEVSHLKSLLDSRPHIANSDAAEIIKKLDSEVDSLRNELEKTKQAEEKLVIMESLIERLSTEADDAKSAEVHSLKVADEWEKKAQSLEVQLMQARLSEKSALKSLASVTKQLEECNASLQDSEFQTAALKQKIELLEDQLDEANEAMKSSLESQDTLGKQLDEINASLQDAESEAALLRGKVESLEIEVADVKKAGSDSGKLADEWKKKTELLEVQLAESSSESLASVTKQLEDSNSSLQDVLSENAALQVKIESLENDLARCKGGPLHADRADLCKMFYLKSGIQTIQEEKLRAFNSETVATSDAESFSEDRNKLLKELEIARQEEDKAKKAMEGLASALHEMTAEARETQERLFTKQVEHEDAYAHIDKLKSALRNTQENYEVMLDEARYEIVCLKKAIEKLETEAKRSEESGKMNGVEDVKNGGKVESRVNGVNEAAEEETALILSLKDRLLGRENELQQVSQENAELQIREAASIKQVNALSAFLVEATTKSPEENDELGELSNSEKEYDLLPNSKEIPMDSVNGSKAEKPKSREDLRLKEENGNGHRYLGREEPVEVEVKMLEEYKSIDESKELSSEMETEEEPVDDDLDLKMGTGSFDQTNGLPTEMVEDGSVSPAKQQQKKKKHLFPKFGNLLKKKSPHK